MRFSRCLIDKYRLNRRFWLQANKQFYKVFLWAYLFEVCVQEFPVLSIFSGSDQFKTMNSFLPRRRGIRTYRRRSESCNFSFKLFDPLIEGGIFHHFPERILKIGLFACKFVISFHRLPV